MRLSCSPSCCCNFDQALMWLGSDPDMTGPATWKRSSEGKWGWWSVLIWPVNPEKKGIILKVSFFCCCSALWVIKVSCIRFSLANIAIYNDLTFLFLKLATRIMIRMLIAVLLKVKCSLKGGCFSLSGGLQLLALHSSREINGNLLPLSVYASYDIFARNTVTVMHARFLFRGRRCSCMCCAFCPPSARCMMCGVKPSALTSEAKCVKSPYFTVMDFISHSTESHWD